MEKTTTTVHRDEATNVFDGALHIGVDRVWLERPGSVGNSEGIHYISLTLSAPALPKEFFRLTVGDVVRYSPGGHSALFEVRPTKIDWAGDMPAIQIAVLRIIDADTIAAIKKRSAWEKGY